MPDREHRRPAHDTSPISTGLHPAELPSDGGVADPVIAGPFLRRQLSSAAVLSLQRTLGNQAVQRMLESQRRPASRRPHGQIQRKLIEKAEPLRETLSGPAAQMLTVIDTENWSEKFQQVFFLQGNDLREMPAIIDLLGKFWTLRASLGGQAEKVRYFRNYSCVQAETKSDPADMYKQINIYFTRVLKPDDPPQKWFTMMQSMVKTSLQGSYVAVEQQFGAEHELTQQYSKLFSDVGIDVKPPPKSATPSPKTPKEKAPEKEVTAEDLQKLLNVQEGAKNHDAVAVQNFLSKYRVGAIDSAYRPRITPVGAPQEKAPSSFPVPPQLNTKGVGYVVNALTIPGGAKPAKIAQDYSEHAFDAKDFESMRGKEDTRAPEELRKSALPFRMGMVVGLNRYETLKKETSEKRVQTDIADAIPSYFPMAAFGFTWRPNWTTNIGSPVDLDTIRAEYNRLTNEQQNRVDAYERSSVPTQDNIAYGSLRDAVTASKYTQSIVGHLSKYNQAVYIQSADNDAPSLKSASQEGTAIGSKTASGVFSRYDALLEKIGKHPLMVIGGYEFRFGEESKKFLDKSDPGDILTFLADYLNRVIRKALQSGLAVYPTEPNLLLKAYAKGETKDFNLFQNDTLFEGDEPENRKLKSDQTLWGNRAAEGRALRENVLKAYPDAKPKEEVIYAPETAVATDPTRFRLGNEVPLPEKHVAYGQQKKFAEMRKQRGGTTKEAFIAQVLADVILQNQSMADRRTFARELRNALRLEHLNEEAASIVLKDPSSPDELLNAELTAIMIYNTAIQRKIFEKAGVSYDDYVKLLKQDPTSTKAEPLDPYLKTNVAVSGEGAATYTTGTGEAQAVPEEHQLKPEHASAVDEKVKQVLKELESLKMTEPEKDFWNELKAVLDRMWQQLQT